MGDVKMLAMIGAFLGAPLALLTLFAASFLGVIVGVPLIILTRNRHYPVPLGTLLAASAFAATFLGQPIIDWYTRFVPGERTRALRPLSLRRRAAPISTPESPVIAGSAVRPWVVSDVRRNPGQDALSGVVASWSGRCTVTVQDEAASRLIQMQHTSTCSRAGEQGFSLIEAMVAITLLSVTLVSLAHLFVAATRATMTSRQVTRAVILAEQKMEQLHAVAWATESDGSPVSDFTSNLAAFTATGAVRRCDDRCGGWPDAIPRRRPRGQHRWLRRLRRCAGMRTGWGRRSAAGQRVCPPLVDRAVGCWTRHAAAAGAGDGSRAAADHDRRRHGRPPAGRGDARRPARRGGRRERPVRWSARPRPAGFSLRRAADRYGAAAGRDRRAPSPW